MGDEKIYLVVDYEGDGEMYIYGVYPEQLFDLAKEHALLVAKANTPESPDWKTTYEFEKDDAQNSWAWIANSERITPVPPPDPSLVLQFLGTHWRSHASHVLELSVMYDIPQNPTSPVNS